jgi:cysteine-rich repeat protein
MSPFCGDSVVDSSEDCDDGNTCNGDGCNNRCTENMGNRQPCE